MSITKLGYEESYTIDELITIFQKHSNSLLTGEETSEEIKTFNLPSALVTICSEIKKINEGVH